MDQCIQLKNYRPLEALFNNLDEVDQEAKDSIILTIFDSLLVSPNTVSFFKHFYENTFIKEEFFELGVDPAFRIANYDEGFNLYYEITNRIAVKKIYKVLFLVIVFYCVITMSKENLIKL